MQAMPKSATATATATSTGTSTRKISVKRSSSRAASVSSTVATPATRAMAAPRRFSSRWTAAARSVRKDDQHGEREEDQRCAVAQQRAQSLQRTDGAERPERRAKREGLDGAGALETVGARQPAHRGARDDGGGPTTTSERGPSHGLFRAMSASASRTSDQRPGAAIRIGQTQRRSMRRWVATSLG